MAATTKPSRSRPGRTARQPVRLSLTVSPELNDALAELARQTGGTKSDVLRKAVALMEVAVQAKREGQRFGIARPGQELATEIVGL